MKNISKKALFYTLVALYAPFFYAFAILATLHYTTGPLIDGGWKDVKRSLGALYGDAFLFDVESIRCRVYGIDSQDTDDGVVVYDPAYDHDYPTDEDDVRGNV